MSGPFRLEWRGRDLYRIGEKTQRVGMVLPDIIRPEWFNVWVGARVGRMKLKHCLGDEANAKKQLEKYA